MNSISNSKKLAKEAVQTIDKFIQGKNIWSLLAYINSDEMISSAAPFVWSVNPDNKDPDNFRCYINSHTFVLADLEVYYDSGVDVEYKNKYRKY